MPKWKKDVTDFTIIIMENKKCGTSYSYIPKPVLDELGNSHSLKFSKTKGRIVVELGDD